MRYALVCVLAATLLAAPESLMAAESISFGEVLHQIEQVSPRLSATKAQAEATAASIAVARSRYWGHAEVFGRDAHYNNARLVNPISPPIDFAAFATDKNQFGYGAMLTLPLDIDGRISAAVRAQQQRNKAATFQVASTRLELFSRGASLYRALQKLCGVRQALDIQLRALRKHHQITEAGIRVGRMAQVELLRINAEIKSVEGRIAALDGDEARLRASLAALLNQPTFTPPVAQLDVRPSGLSLHEVESLAERPDVQVAHSLAMVQEENLKSARREWLPNLSLQAVVSRNQGYNAAGTNTWSVTGQLTWQFWDGGRRFAQIDQVHANREAARQQKISVQNQARAELEAARSAWHAAKLQYEAAQSGLQAALETERIQARRYRSGRLSAVDLLDAEASLARARSSLSAAMADWWLADDQLHLATGHEPAAYHHVSAQHEPTGGTS